MLERAKISNLEFSGIDKSDHPDYCDAYISGGDYDGEEMTEEQLEELNDDSDFVHEELYKFLW